MWCLGSKNDFIIFNKFEENLLNLQSQIKGFLFISLWITVIYLTWELPELLACKKSLKNSKLPTTADKLTDLKLFSKSAAGSYFSDVFLFFWCQQYFYFFWINMNEWNNCPAFQGPMSPYSRFFKALNPFVFSSSLFKVHQEPCCKFICFSSLM